jgi:hypothetical protein
VTADIGVAIRRQNSVQYLVIGIEGSLLWSAEACFCSSPCLALRQASWRPIEANSVEAYDTTLSLIHTREESGSKLPHSKRGSPYLDGLDTEQRSVDNVS